jgi:hypothetical protein
MFKKPVTATEDNPPSETIREPVKNEEMLMAFSGPALAVNRFIITIGIHGVRIAFAEQSPDGPPAQFRTAVMLPFPDAINFYKLLQDLLKEPEAAFEKFKAETQAEQKNG